MLSEQRSELTASQLEAAQLKKNNKKNKSTQVQQLQERLMLSEQRSELAASQLEVAQLDGRTMLARFAQERRQVRKACYRSTLRPHAHVA